MKPFIIVLGCICLLIPLSSTVTAAVFSPYYHMEVELPQQSWIVGLGKTDVQGSIQGYQNEELFSSLKEYAEETIISSYIDTDLLDDPHLFPLTGSTVIDNIDNITIIPRSILDSYSLDNVLLLLSEIRFFNDVSISIRSGVNLLITSGTTMDFHLESAPMLSGIAPFSLGEISDEVSFFSISENAVSSTYYYDGTNVILYPYSNNVDFSVISSDGNELWNNDNTDYIIILQNPDFSISDSSSYHIFPLTQGSKNTIFSMRLQPAPIAPDINNILDALKEITEDFNDISIPFLSDQNNNSDLFESISLSFNGGLLLYNVSKDVTIDNTNHKLQSIGFNRVQDATIMFSSSESLHLDGEFRLIFLGDHFYNTRASNNDSGVTIPIFPIVFWIFALASIVIFHIYKIKKEQTYLITDKRIMYLFIIIHLLILLISFILLDSEFSYQIGNSFMQEVSMNGFSLVCLILLGFQLIMWVIGFLFAGLPLRIITSKIMKYFGFDKSYQHLGKGLVSFSIWPIATIYITMFINILFLFFNPINSLM